MHCNALRGFPIQYWLYYYCSQRELVWVQIITKFCVWHWFVRGVFSCSFSRQWNYVERWEYRMNKAQWQINAAWNNFFSFHSDTNEMIIFYFFSLHHFSFSTRFDAVWFCVCACVREREWMDAWNRINDKRHVRAQAYEKRTGNESKNKIKRVFKC